MKPFSSPLFDLIQICKVVLTQDWLIWNFNTTDMLHVLIEHARNP